MYVCVCAEGQRQSSYDTTLKLVNLAEGYVGVQCSSLNFLFLKHYRKVLRS